MCGVTVGNNEKPAPSSNRLLSVLAGGVTRSFTYSASGNVTLDDNGAGTVLTNLYDSTDRLAEVKNGAATVAAYLHNAQGQRVAKTVGVVTTHYIYDLGGKLIAEADGGTGAATAEYVALEGKPLAYIATAAIYWVHGDHLGTPQMLTDAAGAVVWDATYRPFGEATVTGALTFNLRFPGQYADAETGRHYNYFRDYDASLGRYIQSDPISLLGGWNTYAYVAGNPAIGIDPSGLLGMFYSSEAHVGAGIGDITLICCNENKDLMMFHFAKVCFGASFGVSVTAGFVSGVDGPKCRADTYAGYFLEFSAGEGLIAAYDEGYKSRRVFGIPIPTRVKSGVNEFGFGVGAGWPIALSWCWYIPNPPEGRRLGKCNDCPESFPGGPSP